MQIWLWVIFGVLVTGVMALDLGVFNRKGHSPSMKEALAWSSVWISLALLFNLGIAFWSGPEKALLFLTGYVVEESLSVDNLFVMMLIFQSLRIPREYQHKVLFWGILGAVVMRGIFIAAGVTLIEKFHWIIYLFGAFLIYTGIKLFFQKEEKEEIDPEKNPIVRWFEKRMPLTKQFGQGGRMFLKDGGRLLATPLFIAVLMVESADLVFAVDSIPAVLAITTDPFIVYTSNIFAILGLRSLFFVLSGFVQMFRYLNYGLAGVLTFIGVKMAIADLVHIPTAAALLAIAGMLGASIAASLAIKPAGAVKTKE